MDINNDDLHLNQKKSDCYELKNFGKFEEVSQKKKLTTTLNKKREHFIWHHLTAGFFCSNNFLPMNLFFLRETYKKDMFFFSWKFSPATKKTPRSLRSSDFHPPPFFGGQCFFVQHQKHHPYFWKHPYVTQWYLISKAMFVVTWILLPAKPAQATFSFPFHWRVEFGPDSSGGAV